MLLTRLLPHQAKAERYIKSALLKRGACACFMFKGSGKSLTALSVADKIGGRVLITSDKTNAEVTWPEQIDRHTSGWEYVVRPSTKKDWKKIEEYIGRPLAIIVNYEYLTNKQNLMRLRRLGFNLWIGDESSEFKDQRTRKHRCLDHLVQTIPFRVMLNGEPTTESLEDLFGQFKILDGGKRLGTSITAFRIRYMMPDPRGYDWVPKRGALTEIQEYLRDISYWCHFDSDVSMPVPHYYCIKVPMTPGQKLLNDSLLSSFAAELDGAKIETNYAPVIFQKMLQIAGGVFRPSLDSLEDVDKCKDRWVRVDTNKIAVVQKIIDENPNSKIVIWHSYIPETTLLAFKLNCENLLVAVSEGELSISLEKFKSLKGGGVLLIRCSTCRGINQLADCDIAICYSNPLSFARRSQLEGRSQRISSTTDVTHIIDIVTEGGVDEAVYNMLQGKRSFSLTMPELRSILEQQRIGKEVS